MPLATDNIVINRKFSTLASSVTTISKLTNLDSDKAVRHTTINILSQFRSASNATPNNLDSIISQASNNLTVKTVLSKNKQERSLRSGQEEVQKKEIQKPNLSRVSRSERSAYASKNILQVPSVTVKDKSINSLGLQGNAAKKKIKGGVANMAYPSYPFYKISKLTVRLKAIESKIKNWKKKIHLSTDLLNNTSLRYVESYTQSAQSERKNNLFSRSTYEYFSFNSKQKKLEKKRLSRILYSLRGNYLKKLRLSADPKA